MADAHRPHGGPETHAVVGALVVTDAEENDMIKEVDLDTS